VNVFDADKTRMNELLYGEKTMTICVRSCSGVVSLKNGSLMTAIKILLYTVYTVMLTDDDDDDDEL